ncbi:MAG: amino acid-binding protein [Coriobacteriia bacterium]|nr:amino acid-binding protein [Coriobacteriia bacterium]MCL2750414.1 amino acid-binding protein [Coriobacteriia bacterium]
MPTQVTVFLENEQGRLAAMCRTLADANVNMSALTVADTASYGVARLLVDKPGDALAALAEAGYRVRLVDVSAVEIPNVPGSLALLLEAFDKAGLNLEYAYCFESGKEGVVVVFRAENIEGIADIVESLGYRLLKSADL